MSSTHNVESILEDKAGNIWFGGINNEGVYHYNGKAITNLGIKEQKPFTWARPFLAAKNGDVRFINWGSLPL
jgi:hypothetical protein